MESIFFPQTVIPPDVLRMALGCFAKTNLLRPSEGDLPDYIDAAVTDERLTICCPPDADSASMARLKAAYRSWATTHAGADLHHLATAGDSPPYLDDTATAQIRQAIQRSLKSTPETDPGLSMVDQARLFLEVAQDLDQEAVEIAGALDRVALMEADMVAEALGQVPAMGTLPASSDPHRLSWVPKRMRAWARVAATLPSLPSVWIIHDRIVLEEMAGQGDRVAPMAPPIPIPGADTVAGDMFADRLETALGGKAEITALAPATMDDVVDSERLGQLTVYRTPRQLGLRLFGESTHLAGPKWLILIEGK